MGMDGLYISFIAGDHETLNNKAQNLLFILGIVTFLRNLNLCHGGIITNNTKVAVQILQALGVLNRRQ